MQEEIVGDIRELNGEIRHLNTEIRQLNTEIEELANKQQLTPTDIALGVQISEKTALMTAKQNTLTATRNEIATKTQLLTALITSQQGNFSSVSSHISIVLSQSFPCNLLPNLFRHLLFTHSGSATAQGKR